jgi:DNA-binding transcriptional ArsR family regulator
VSESQVLAALAHPLRRRLLAALRAEGPATAGVLAARTDQAVGSVSHHLRTLGACGLIEEAPELARDRRERWWRPTPGGAQFATSRQLNLTAAEATELGAEIDALLARWSHRPGPAGAHRRPIIVVAQALPTDGR